MAPNYRMLMLVSVAVLCFVDAQDPGVPGQAGPVGPVESDGPVTLQESATTTTTTATTRTTAKVTEGTDLVPVPECSCPMVQKIAMGLGIPMGILLLSHTILCFLWCRGGMPCGKKKQRALPGTQPPDLNRLKEVDSMRFGKSGSETHNRPGLPGLAEPEPNGDSPVQPEIPAVRGRPPAVSPKKGRKAPVAPPLPEFETEVPPPNQPNYLDLIETSPEADGATSTSEGMPGTTDTSSENPYYNVVKKDNTNPYYNVASIDSVRPYENVDSANDSVRPYQNI